MTFSSVATLSSIGLIYDAITYKNNIYLATSNGVYRYNPSDNSVTNITTTYKPSRLSIFNNKLNITDRDTTFVFYDGSTISTKASSGDATKCFAQFSDGVYAALQGNVTQQLIYFYDSELNYLGYKNIHGKICDYNGVQKTIDFIYLLIPYNGQFIATLQTTDGTGYICRSNDGGESWIAYSIIDTIIERGFVDGGLVLLLGSDIFYSIDNGSLFNKVTNSHVSVRTGSPFIIQTDLYKDIIIPVESSSGYFEIDRIRQSNIAKGIIAHNFSSDSGYIVLANGLKIQWFKLLENGTHNFLIPFTDYVCALAPNQSGYAVGVSRVGSSPYSQFKTASNYSTNKTDLIFIGY